MSVVVHTSKLVPAKEWEELQARLKKYAEALEWYADAKVYELDANFPIFEDEGKRAREALWGNLNGVA